MISARAVKKRTQRGFLCDLQRLLIGWRRRNRALARTVVLPLVQLGVLTLMLNLANHY
jgi:hypothetical protein